MKFNVKIVGSSLLILLCAVMLYVFRSIPVAKIWSNYSVVYAEKSIPEEDVLKALEEAGCEGVIASSLQKVPLVSNFTPVEYDDKTEYLSKRNMYFTDRAKMYSLYYVPAKFEKNALNGVKTLSKMPGLRVGMDTVQSYPWLVVLTCAVIYVFFIVLSSHRVLFSVVSFMPLMYAFSIPEYGVCCSVCLIFMAVFLFQRFFKRKYAAQILLKNFYFEALIFGSLAILFVNSPKTGFLGLVVVLSSAAASVLASELVDVYESTKSFTFDKIITARVLPVMYQRASKVCLFLSIPMMLILCIFFSTARFAPKSSVSSISMPAPLDSEKLSALENLPGIKDFYNWSFNTIVFPYRNLNDYAREGALSEGDSVKYTRFTQTEQGIISREETVYSYDDSFKKEMHNYIDNLGYPSIEAFMLSQGENVCIGYSNDFNAKTTNDSLNLVLIIISIMIPLALYAVYMVSGKIKYENSK